jgi:hypothetical protein
MSLGGSVTGSEVGSRGGSEGGTEGGTVRVARGCSEEGPAGYLD